MLCAGGSRSLFHPRVCGRLRAGFGLRISARRLAVRAGRGRLGGDRAAALERQAAHERIARQRCGVLVLFRPRQRRPSRFPFPLNELTMWPDRRLLELFKTEFPILQAPMAGVMDADLVIAAAQGGALGSLPCAMLSVEKAREQVNIIRQRVSAPVNMNFFCHRAVDADPKREAGWKQRLAPYYKELGVDPAAPVNAANRAPFDAAMCELVEELKPEVVSFHFGLPDQALLARVKAAGSIVISSATIVKEAIWLEENGADAIIAQGAEAGGHRGMFLTEDVGGQPGTFALVPQVVDAVKVPVIAAGGIADGRGIAAAFALGAAG